MPLASPLGFAGFYEHLAFTLPPRAPSAVAHIVGVLLAVSGTASVLLSALGARRGWGCNNDDSESGQQ